MRLRLTVAAPIRAGGREQQVSKLEFVRRGGELHAVSPRKLARLLLEKSERTLDDWNIEVLRKGRDADLTRFLSDKGLLSPGVLGEITRYSALCEHARVNEFQPHARDAWGALFVPGSAIKGAIRAAVMWTLIDRGTANKYVEESLIEAERRNRRPRSDRFGEALNKQTLQSYRLPHSGGTAVHRDLLRAVKVSDGYGEPKSRVENIVIQSYVENRRVRTASLGAGRTIYVECLAPGSWIEFDLKVDEKILHDFRQQNKDENIPFDDEASLLNLVRTFYAEVWDFERRYYGIFEDAGAAATEEPREIPTLEEWVKQRTGKELSEFSRRGMERRKLETEYKNIFVYGEEPEPHEPSGTDFGGVRDGQEIRLQSIRDFYAGASSPGFRLGWGSGLMSTTVDLRLDDKNMGKVLQLISSRHHKGDRIEGPKSRKLVGSGGSPRWPMGWARLEVQR